MNDELAILLTEIRQCRACEQHLPYEPRPVVTASHSSRILVIGQAPGRRVHETGIAWNDPSGDRLRDWMGLTREQFYDVSNIALVPMGFCYPGTGRGGDLPPRPECAELWHDRVLQRLPNLELTLLIGRYAQDFRLGKNFRPTLAETVRCWRDFIPHSLPMPHPSPRNNRWLRNNSWFLEEVVPYLKRRVKRVFEAPSKDPSRTDAPAPH